MASQSFAVELNRHNANHVQKKEEHIKTEISNDGQDTLLVKNAHGEHLQPLMEDKITETTHPKKASPFSNLSNSIIATHKAVKNFLRQIGHGFQETMSESATRNRAIYIFIAVVFLVILCCVGLQFILSMAKSSRINLNKLEKLLKERQSRDQESVDEHETNA